jgi:hypothetical protein
MSAAGLILRPIFILFYCNFLFPKGNYLAKMRKLKMGFAKTHHILFTLLE